MDQAFDYGLLNTQTDPRFGDRRYGRLGTIAKNGCGMIALYNVERAARPETRFEPFYDARQSIKTNLFGLLGTRPSTIRRNLEAKGFKVCDLDVKRPQANPRHDAVIVLYWYWFGAHYVTGLLNKHGEYTFYNYYVSPYGLSLARFLETLKKSKQHAVRAWGVDFPQQA